MTVTLSSAKKSLLCRIGIHAWAFKLNDVRYCSECLKQQKFETDLFGDTSWSDIQLESAAFCLICGCPSLERLNHCDCECHRDE